MASRNSRIDGPTETAELEIPQLRLIVYCLSDNSIAVRREDWQYRGQLQHNRQVRELARLKLFGLEFVVNIEENLNRVQNEIAQAAQISGRNVTNIELVAVTKTHPAEIVREAVDAGHLVFGESKVQEARVKIPLLPSNLRWHFIGHLQKNKIRHALPLFEMIHSVDSLDLAQAIDRIAHEDGLHPRILLEVNVTGEGSKFGFKATTLRAELESLFLLPRLSIEGLMCIPPLAEEAETSRKYFVELRELRDALEQEFQVNLPHLSMGMTNDYSVAVEEGATLVRVGTAIFGERKRRNTDL